MSTARMVPTMPPRPPDRLAPPSTTAVTTDSSRPMPALTDAPPTCDSRMRPESPASAAESRNADEDGAIGPDAGQPRRGGAGADGVHRAAVGRVAQDEEEDDDHRGEDVDRDGQLQDARHAQGR